MSSSSSSSAAASSAAASSAAAASSSSAASNEFPSSKLNRLYIDLFKNAYAGVRKGGETDRTNDHETTDMQRSVSIKTWKSVLQQGHSSRLFRILSCLRTNIWMGEAAESILNQSDHRCRNKGPLEFPLVINIPATVAFFTSLNPLGLKYWYEKIPGTNRLFQLFKRGEYKFTRGEVLDAVKIVYGYATGGLMINAEGEILTDGKGGSSNPRAEIEHFVAWRTMVNQGGGLAEPFRRGDTMQIVCARGHTGKQVKSEGRTHPFNNRLAQSGVFDAEQRGLVIAEGIQEIIQNLRVDPLIYSSCFGEAGMQDLAMELVAKLPNSYLTLMEMIVSMERLAQHGMWWCCRLFNQLKLNAAFFKIVHDRNIQTLSFQVSESRVRAVVEMMLCYIFSRVDGSGIMYPDFDSLNRDRQLSAGERAEEIWMRVTLVARDYERWSQAERQLKTVQGMTKMRTIKKKIQGIKERVILKRIGNDGVDVHYVSAMTGLKKKIEAREFDWLRRVCVNISSQGDYNTIKEQIFQNVKYIAEYLCEDFNLHLYDRGFFLAERIMLSGSRDLKKSKLSGQQAMPAARFSSAAAHISPKKPVQSVVRVDSIRKAPSSPEQLQQRRESTLTKLRQQYITEYRRLRNMNPRNWTVKTNRPRPRIKRSDVRVKQRNGKGNRRSKKKRMGKRRLMDNTNNTDRIRQQQKQALAEQQRQSKKQRQQKIQKLRNQKRNITGGTKKYKKRKNTRHKRKYHKKTRRRKKKKKKTRKR